MQAIEIINNDYNVGTPERAVAGFLGCWQANNWNDITFYTQLSWARNTPNPNEFIKGFLRHKTLYSGKIISVEFVTSVFAKVKIEVKYRFNPLLAGLPQEKYNILFSKEIIANVIREVGVRMPSESGKWGINPLTVFRETDVFDNN